MNNSLKKLTLLLSLLLLSTSVHSEQLDLPKSPLFIGTPVKSNLILSIDDSGSMDAETVYDTNDGALWWSLNNETFAIDSEPVYKSNNDYKFFYVFNLNDNVLGGGHRIVPPIIQYAFNRSSNFNKAYYNPNVTYSPWVSKGSKQFDNIDPTAAPVNPNKNTKIDLTKNIYSNSGDYRSFYTPKGMVIPKDTEYDNQTAGSDTQMTENKNVKIKFFPATYFTVQAEGDYTVGNVANGNYVTGDCATPNPNHYSIFEKHPSTITKVDSLSYDGQCLKKIEVIPSTSTYLNTSGRSDCAVTTECTYQEEIQNFANWFSYSRRRHLALRSANGEAFKDYTSIRVGVFTINKRNNVTMWDLANPDNVTTFYDKLYGIGANGGTPNRAALKYAGEQYRRTDSGKPIIEACQKNFTLFFTDGFAADTNHSGTGNADKNAEAPYADDYSNTLADIAYKYYNENLRPDLEEGMVVPPSACESKDFDSNNATPLDCNTNLHMNTYTIGLGAKGTLFGNGYSKVADAYTNPPTWPDVNGERDNKQIDDLYHAAINGRGEMFNAESADTLTIALQNALLTIKETEGSAGSVAASSNTLETDTTKYAASFDSAEWTGDLKAYSLETNGNKVKETFKWSAAAILKNKQPNDRTIITYNDTLKEGVAFRWDDSDMKLSSQMQADLQLANDNNGENALGFIRGTAYDNYRQRISVLGDIVYSSPIFIGGTSFSKWPSTAPFPTIVGQRYVDLKRTRQEVVYVGANDGMLHGFSAATGEELLAYIPNFLASTESGEGLNKLTSPDYSHQYYVDLSPSAADVYLDITNDDENNPEWRTILIGGTRAGGKGLFALDITNPDNFSEEKANTIALWEFTHPDLGYTYSQPTIGMVGDKSNARWAAIFGNGYNSSNTGAAKLFILYLDADLSDGWTEGTDFIIIDTKTTTTSPNGLATPLVVDSDFDGIFDRAYAGDLLGNMWAFNLNTYKIVYGTDDAPKPLFIAKDDSGNPQPITAKPSAGVNTKQTYADNEPNLIVLFGTGRYLEQNDLSDSNEQTFYGIWDNGNHTQPPARTSLQEQTLTTYSSQEGLIFISDNTIDFDTQSGWYIDFLDTGERSIAVSQIRHNNVIFDTFTPYADQCSVGGKGLPLLVDYITGGQPDIPPFYSDTIENADELGYVTINGEKEIVVGIKRVIGSVTNSSVIGNYLFTSKIKNNMKDDGEANDCEDCDKLSGLPNEGDGRQSWKQLW